MNTRELADRIDKMNPCELVHFLYDDKPVSKYELHWCHDYNSKFFFISEKDYHDMMDQYSESVLAVWLNVKYNNKASVCMTITH